MKQRWWDALFWVLFAAALLIGGWIGSLRDPGPPETTPTVQCVVRGVSQPWEVVAYINRCPND